MTKPSVTLAFHGDAAIRDDLLARLRRHVEGRTLEFGATRWDGVRGSPLGVSAESDSSADYAARFGYPLAVATLLDLITTHVAVDDALAATFAWVESVPPATDLTGVPVAIVGDMLRRVGAADRVPSRYAALMEMHRRDLAGETISRSDWSRLRGEIEDAAADAAPADARALRACAIACWPLRTSRSVLTGLVELWAMDTTPESPADFTDADRTRAEAMLQTIIRELQPPREEIPGIFRDRDPDLAAGYEAELRRINTVVADRLTALPAIILGHLAAAGTA